jgi:hypothetical protein
MLNRSNVEIRNGTVTSFYVGIRSEGASDLNHRVINIRAHNNRFAGMWLSGKGHLARDCTASNNKDTGISIENGAIIGCVAYNNVQTGFWFAGPGIVIGNVSANIDEFINTGFYLGPGTGEVVVDRNCSFHFLGYIGGPANASYWGINTGKRFQ